MEVLETHNALVSNLEVLLLIKEQEARRTQAARARKGQPAAPPPTKLPNLLTIEFEVRKYLSKDAVKHLTVDGMHKLMLALGKYPLTKAEKLQIVNLRPISKIALHVIVEEMEERLTEEAIDALISDVADCWKLPQPAVKAQPAEAAAAAAGSDGPRSSMDESA